MSYSRNNSPGRAHSGSDGRWQLLLVTGSAILFGSACGGDSGTPEVGNLTAEEAVVVCESAVEWFHIVNRDDWREGENERVLANHQDERVALDALAEAVRDHHEFDNGQSMAATVEVVSSTNLAVLDAYSEGRFNPLLLGQEVEEGLSEHKRLKVFGQSGCIGVVSFDDP